MTPVSIGPLRFERPLFMAPMEGITDVPFRKMVRRHGCGVTCTQMVHAEAMLFAPPHKLRNVTALAEDERPVGFQLVSPDPERIGEAARRAEAMGAAFIDINMGCPAKSVVVRGAGAALLRDPERAARVIRSVVQSVRIPVTVKIRAGWDDQCRSGSEVARLAEEEGAVLVTVHARPRSQFHKGVPDWSVIRELKERLKIPVVGNGGVFRPEDVEQMVQETAADGVMVARGALGNPWIFSLRRPTVGELRTTILEHLEDHLSFYPDAERALLMFRKHIVWYTKGLRNAAEFRVRLFEYRTREKTVEMLNQFFDQLDPQSRPGVP